ncbi:dihydrofolate reductase family protein [uncultured Nocardioides sp.]|uniref:dihydrofolate reductase family protein n=1 Tax=uncultured Nocardioides sp. TaxID=198441 RepID=UPI00261AA494|nr:dihydrofolate reductase family protein [uncultured Nocardioides sp.]
MTLVIGDISVSVDGFVTGPDPGPDAGLGRGGEELHRWVGSGAASDRETLDRAAEAGAVVMGRRLFDVVDGPHGWTDGTGYGADRDARPPLVVVTALPPGRPRLAATHDLTFVTDGLRPAVEQARRLAGVRDVYVMGGAATVRGCLDVGLLDLLRLHVAPVVLGGGTPLFAAAAPRSLRQVEVVVGGAALHVTYETRARNDRTRSPSSEAASASYAGREGSANRCSSPG